MPSFTLNKGVQYPVFGGNKKSWREFHVESKNIRIWEGGNQKFREQLFHTYRPPNSELVHVNI